MMFLVTMTTTMTMLMFVLVSMLMGMGMTNRASAHRLVWLSFDALSTMLLNLK
jgi:hypothetical protein